MSLTTGIHLHDHAALVGEPSSGDRGYVRIQTEGPDDPGTYAAIHGNGPDLRRLAAACLALADVLDPPTTYDDDLNAALLTSYGRINDLYEHSPRMGESDR